MDWIAHLAIGTTDLERTANFYKEVFGLFEPERTPDQEAHQIVLSDGHMNLNIGNVPACFPSVGLIHFGFVADDLDKARQRLEAAGAVLISALSPRPGQHGEFKYKTPEGVTMCLSQQDPIGQRVEPATGKIQHIALFTPHVVKSANFYKEAFGLYETRRESDATQGTGPTDGMVHHLYLWDGYVNITLCRARVGGMFHFGFAVEPPYFNETRERMEANGAPCIKAPLGAVYNEFKHMGPDGVLIDISQRGWSPQA